MHAELLPQHVAWDLQNSWNSTSINLGPRVDLELYGYGIWNYKVLPAISPPSQKKVRVSLPLALFGLHFGIGGGGGIEEGTFEAYEEYRAPGSKCK